MALPQLTEAQRAENLKKAAAARKARADLREKLRTGKTSIKQVLTSTDATAERVPVRYLLESLPGYGKAKAQKLMQELNIPDNRRVKGLGSHQREMLIERLG